MRPFGLVIVHQGSKPLLERSVLEGNVGVYLFFMISGFMLALPFLGARSPGRAGRCPSAGTTSAA